MRSAPFEAEWRRFGGRVRAFRGGVGSLAALLLLAGCGVLPLHTMQAPAQVAAAPVAVAAPAVRPSLDTLTYASSGPAPTGVAAPVAVAAPAPAGEIGSGYLLDSGDKLRVVVFGQDGLSNSYLVDPAGNITMPLIGAVAARGISTPDLARAVGARLRNGFIREPHVAIEVETYRPFFILGEVTYPGQYPFVPNMTVETAVAIAGGFTPRAYRYDVKLTRHAGAQAYRAAVPLNTPMRPGDTITIEERWF
jgi:polysaccharide biosynthesis/export protein